MNAAERVRQRLHDLYPDDANAVYQQLMVLLANTTLQAASSDDYFSERTVTLITYGDSLSRPDQAPLVTLNQFLNDHLSQVISTVHILPFYPYSSDDGFSVIDYYAVEPRLGSWQDIHALSANYRLMFDAVINHMSAQSS